MNEGAQLMLMIKIGLAGTVFGFLFSALGKGQIAKYIAFATVLSCVTIIGRQLVNVVSDLLSVLARLE